LGFGQIVFQNLYLLIIEYLNKNCNVAVKCVKITNRISDVSETEAVSQILTWNVVDIWLHVDSNWVVLV
jgi:hypothetical protein